MLWKKVFAVVCSGKVQGGLASCFLKAALRDVFIGFFCLFSACTETEHSAFFHMLLVQDKTRFSAQVSAKGLVIVWQVDFYVMAFVT